jgi:cysteine desulfurase
MRSRDSFGPKLNNTINYLPEIFGEVSNMKRPIYLDYSATTPVDPRVAKKMMAYLTMEGEFGNPASRSHNYGWTSEEAVETARKQVADLINADPKEIIWTSGATESDNLAIKGAAHFYQKKGKHIVTSKTEHKAVLDSCRQLEREGFEVTYLDPEPNGLIDLNKFTAALRDDTILASIMHVNNEIGVIQDIAALGEIARSKGVIFHVDAAQSAGKVPIDLKNLKVDLMSFSAHKIYGPKGIGALYVRRKPRIRLEAQMHGGGHERGLRSGTLATHQIVGMGEAFRIAKEDMVQENERIRKLRDRFLQGIKDIDEIYINGDLEHRIPHNLNVSFAYVEGESLMMAMRDLAVSSGSACTSASLEPSYVLRALGREDELAHSSIRFTLGRFTTEEDIDYAIQLIHEKIEKLRELSPLWEMYKEGIDLKSVQWAAH